MIIPLLAWDGSQLTFKEEVKDEFMANHRNWMSRDLWAFYFLLSPQYAFLKGCHGVRWAYKGTCIEADVSALPERYDVIWTPNKNLATKLRLTFNAAENEVRLRKWESNEQKRFRSMQRAVERVQTRLNYRAI